MFKDLQHTNYVLFLPSASGLFLKYSVFLVFLKPRYCRRLPLALTKSNSVPSKRGYGCSSFIKNSICCGSLIKKTLIEEILDVNKI